MLENKNSFGQKLGQKLSEWQKCEKPIVTTILGKFCLLEPLKIQKHALELFNVLCSKDRDADWTYLPYGPFLTQKEFENFLRLKLKDENALLYAIINRSNQMPIGFCAYSRIDPENGSIEIGHVNFSPLLQKTAMATEAIYLLAAHAFEKFGYRRLEWKCHSLNEASKKAATRFGFTFEGIFRNHFVQKKHSRDSMWFSIIDSELPLLKQKFESWLAADNFNADGSQKKRLSDMQLCQ